MIKRNRYLLLAFAAAFLLVTGTARALINANFTPVNLVEQADFILLLKLKPADKDGKVIATVVRCLKGEKKAPKGPLTIDLSITAKKAHAEQVKKMIASLGDGPVLLFVGTGERGDPVSMIHFGGKWVTLDSTDKPAIWDMFEIDNSLEGTWAGGTDMLLRAVKMLLKSPDAGVPVVSGVKWDEHSKWPAFKGKVAGMSAVDLDGKGKLRLYAACDAGDRIYAYDKGTSKFVDETGKHKLSSKSKRAVWADFNADGCLDLASWDGKALSLHLQTGDGTLGVAKAVGAAPAGECLGLAALDVGVPGKPGLLFSTKTGPVLLKPGKDGAFTAGKLPLGKADLAALGTPGPCLVADLDDDNLTDLLFPLAKGSLFFKGKLGGDFAEAVKCAVGLGRPPFDAFLGDYDMDGRLDVFCAGRDGCSLWHNRGGLKFESSMHVSGELAYISKAGAITGNTCDVNNDGRQDIYIVYSAIPNTGPQIFFNRGFRSYGHAHTIDITEKQIIGGAEVAGQQCGIIADLTDDGAQDQAVVLKNGDLYIFPRAIENEEALCVRVGLPLGGKVTGPVKVTAWSDQSCLGAWNVVAGTQEAFFGQIETGDIKLKWRLPGSKEVHTKEITLEDKAVRFVIPLDGSASSPKTTANGTKPSSGNGGARPATGDKPPKAEAEGTSTAIYAAAAVGAVVVLILIVVLAKRKKQ